MPYQPTQMAPEELLNEAYRTYAQDKARLGTTNPAAYPGKTAAPMSSLTQRAREYQNRFAQKRAPYAKKIDTVLAKPNEGLSPQNTQDLLNRIRQSQEGANENTGVNALRNQFRSSFTPEREQGFRSLGQQDINRGLGEFSGNLQDINKAAGNLEAQKNRQVIARLQGLSQDKQSQRQALIGNLEQFGNQKHAHANKMLNSERAKFYQQEEAPQRNLDQLASRLEPLRQRFQGELHPDLARSTSQEIQNILGNYNAASGKTGSNVYPGTTVAGLTPEMQASYDLLERISPSIKDTYAPQRKEIVQGFLKPETTAGRAVQNLPGRMQGYERQLEEDARQRLQKDLGGINNRYIKLGQYGSPQHIAEAERRAQEIQKAQLMHRNDTAASTLRNQIGLEHEGEIGNLKKLGHLASLGQNEFRDLHTNIRNLNKQGATKWRNEQDELEDLYNNYQNQQGWNTGRGEGTASRAGKGSGASSGEHDIFGNQESRGLQLDQLNNIAARYSELEKEPLKTAAPLTTIPQAQQAMQANTPAKMAIDSAMANAKRKAATLNYMDLMKASGGDNPDLNLRAAASELYSNRNHMRGLYDVHTAAQRRINPTGAPTSVPTGPSANPQFNAALQKYNAAPQTTNRYGYIPNAIAPFKTGDIKDYGRNRR